MTTDNSRVRHTPGPWLIRKPDNSIYDTDDDIANVVARGPYGLITITEELDVADARLIAAAPDLLEAVRLFLAYDQGDEKNGMELMANYNAALVAARAAIRKAKGEAQ